MNPSYKADFLIVGCGFAGTTFARLAAENGFTSHIIDGRDHVGGNCYSYRDEPTGIEVHKYGPHIFHTDSSELWTFINRFTTFNTYIHRVKAINGGRVYSLPVNLHTINHFFNKSFTPNEAEQFLEAKRERFAHITNFEEQVLSSVGRELYEAFYRDYSKKHWGVDPKQIAVSVAKRLPVRFYYDDNYFADQFQGIPVDGYTAIFHRMLEHEKIQLKLKTSFEEYKNSWRQQYRRLVFTGSIDEFFDYCHGELPYRTVHFKELRGTEIQGTAQMNYTDLSVPYTRIHEHKWFTPEKSFERSIAFEEYAEGTTSKFDPYYPVRHRDSNELFHQYQTMGEAEQDVIFVGRLAEFKYYDMHQIVASAFAKFKTCIKTLR